MDCDPRLLAGGSLAGRVAVDVRLFHDSRCRLVHKYRVFRGTFPHPALRGKVMNKLLGLVNRAMAIAKLTDFLYFDTDVRIGDGGCSGELFSACSALTPSLVSARRVSFTHRVTVIEAAPEDAAVREQTLRSSPALLEPAPMDIQLQEPVCTLPPEKDGRFSCSGETGRFFASGPAGVREFHLARDSTGTGRHSFDV